MTVTIRRTIELDIEVEVDVTPGEPDHYDRSIGGPGGWSPGSGPEAEIVSAQTEDGWDVMKLLTRDDIASIEEAAIEQAGDLEADAAEAAAEDAWEARREMRAERD